MTIKVERMEGGDPAGDPALASAIEEEIKKQILVSGKVEICTYGTLPRSERKSKRVFDNRRPIKNEGPGFRDRGLSDFERLRSVSTEAL